MPYKYTADASGTGAGDVLSQKDEVGSRPVVYAYSKLSAAEQGYRIFRRQLLSGMYALHTSVQWLQESKFTIFIDHPALKNLDTREILS